MVAAFVLLTIVTLLLVEFVVGKLEGRRLVVEPIGARSEAPETDVPRGVFFHQGHSWARVEDDGVVTVGVDGFVRAMTGCPDDIDLPAAGARLVQGERGWTLRRGERTIPVLAPIDGDVLERNEALVRHPELLEADPYGRGWLMKVRPTNLSGDRRNLLDGWVASRWMEESYRRLSHFFSPDLGEVMQDGGGMVTGLIDAIDADRLDDALREFFLADR